MVPLPSHRHNQWGQLGEILGGVKVPECAARHCQTDLTPTLIRQITAKILLGPTGSIAVMTTLQTRRAQLLEAQQADLAITGRLQEAKSLLAGTPAEITEWDEALVRQTVETVKVLSAHEILVCLKGGMEIRETVL